MRQYQKLSEALKQQLSSIEPSSDGNLIYYPCAVKTTMETFDSVYLVEEKSYFEHWGVWPEDDPAKKSIPVSDLMVIHQSHSRLPAKYANQLYRCGESGMGYYVFTIGFRNGLKQTYISGGAVDFITYPDGASAEDVAYVLPNTGRDSANKREAPSYLWCLYSL